MQEKSLAQQEAEQAKRIEGQRVKLAVVDEVTGEGLEQVVAPPDLQYPEWLAETADLGWDELTDEQRLWFENYRAFMDEEHKDLAVRPKDLRSLSERMAAELKSVTPKIHKEVIHFMGYDKHGSKGPGVYCSCGMHKVHRRGKVLAAWADKHYEKYGHYWKRS